MIIHVNFIVDLYNTMHYISLNTLTKGNNMKLIKNETNIKVHEYNHKTSSLGDYLYTGTFVGFGLIGLGINGSKQGILVCAECGDNIGQIRVVSLEACFVDNE